MDTYTPTEEQLRKAIEFHKGSVSGAAQSLGISRQSVYRLLGKYGITIDRISIVKRMGT